MFNNCCFCSSRPGWWICRPRSMTAPASRPRPLSTAALPPSPPISHALRRKYSLDHGESCSAAWRGSGSTEMTEVPAGASAPPEEDKEENTFLANGNKEENQNMPLESNKVLKKQNSFESVDNYFYDFFDRNCATATTSEDREELDNSQKGATRIRRNLNVRPRSWVTSATSRVEDPRRIRRRQTDPCGRDFLSDYERALSSLLYQPYECRNEASGSTFDDSDVGFWLTDSSRYQERYSSSSSSSTSSSSLGELVRRWGSSKDPSTQSIRALLGNAAERVGNPAESSDLNPGVPTQTGPSAQSASRHGVGMLVNVETETRDESAGVSVNCHRAVPATVSTVPGIQCNNVSNVRIVPRTFTSTEAQTDDVLVDQIRSNRDREQRRRERRERRHQRRLANHLHPQMQTTEVWHTPIPEPVVDRLPDILNSHLPPPYTTLPLGLQPPLPVPTPVVTTVPGPSPQQGLRFPFAIVPVGRRRYV